MVQRALIAASLTVTLASLSLGGLVWHQSNQAVSAAADATRRFAEVQATNQAKMVELLNRSQSTSEELLKQLQTMARPYKRLRRPTDPGDIKLAQETLDGPPAVGYQVTLWKGSASIFEQSIRRESDTGGLVDFGVVHPGDWGFELSSSLDEQSTWKCRGNINVLPGTKVVKMIVCPGRKPAQSEVKIHVQWPSELAEKNLRLQMTFVQGPATFQPLLKWTLVDSSGVVRPRMILSGPEKKHIELNGSMHFDLWHFYNPLKSLAVQSVYADFHSQRLRSESDAVAMEPGTFLPRSLIVLRPLVSQNAANKGERFEVLAHTVATDEFAHDVRYYSQDPNDGQEPLGTSWKLWQFKGRVTVSPSYWRQTPGAFRCAPGRSMIGRSRSQRS